MARLYSNRAATLESSLCAAPTLQPDLVGQFHLTSQEQGKTEIRTAA